MNCRFATRGGPRHPEPASPRRGWASPLQQKRLAEIVEQLRLIPEIVEAHGMSGQADLLVRVVCTDADDLFRIDGTILAVDGVERTATSLVMSELIPFRARQLLDRALESTD